MDEQIKNLRDAKDDPRIISLFIDLKAIVDNLKELLDSAEKNEGPKTLQDILDEIRTNAFALTVLLQNF